MCQNVNTIIRAMCESLPILKHCRWRLLSTMTFDIDKVSHFLWTCVVYAIASTYALQQQQNDRFHKAIFIVANFCLLLRNLFFVTLHPIAKCVIFHIWTSNNRYFCISSDKYAKSKYTFYSLFVTSDALQRHQILSQSQSVVHPLSGVGCFFAGIFYALKIAFFRRFILPFYLSKNCLFT